MTAAFQAAAGEVGNRGDGGYSEGDGLTYCDVDGSDPSGYLDSNGNPLIASIYGDVTGAADRAVDYWVGQGNPVMGTLAMTMTEEYAVNTTLSLLPSVGVLRWAARPYWQYSSTGITNSTWLARGWGWKHPYAVGSEARNALALPPWNSGATVKPVYPTGFVRGPRPVGPQPQWGHPAPTGLEYRVAPWGGP